MSVRTENLIFDVGNVLIGFRPKEMLVEHGMSPEQISEFCECVFEDPLWKEFDLENLPFTEVIERYCEKYPALSEDIRWLMANAWQMPVPRPAVWAKVHQLKEKGYKIYLLSNYSSVLFDMHVGKAPFLEDLDGAVISCHTHCIKPEPEIYRCLFARYSLQPGSCLFFDDREENVESSRRLGMPAVHITSEKQLLEQLDQLPDVSEMFS